MSVRNAMNAIRRAYSVGRQPVVADAPPRIDYHPWVASWMKAHANKVSALRGQTHEHVPRDPLAVTLIRSDNADQARDWPLRWRCWCGELVDDATREVVRS